MPKFGVLEYFPLQILSFQDLQEVMDSVIEEYSQDWETKVAEREWRKLAGDVREALLEAFLVGPPAKQTWLAKVAQRLADNEKRRSRRALREIRVGYISLLDQIYGAIFRHVLRRVPTAVSSGSGQFYLSRISMPRYARVRATDVKPALEEVMEFIYLGGPRIDVDFFWQPLGSSLDVSPRRQQHIE